MKFLAVFAILFFTVVPVAQAAEATLTFSPSTGTYTVGSNFNVAIQLNTGGAQTDGTRAIVKYDPSLLEVVLVSDGVYDSYPTQTYGGGTVLISGISATSGPYYSGSGTFATITFKPKTTGTANLSFDYTAGSTTDSNVAEHGTNADVLSSVGTASFTLQGGSGSTGPTSAPVGGGGPETSTGQLPDSGVKLWTFLAALLAVGSLSSGSFLLRRLLA